MYQSVKQVKHARLSTSLLEAFSRNADAYVFSEGGY